MNRRNFITRTGSAGLFILAGGSSALMTGCGNIFTQISDWIPTAILSINGIVTLLGSSMPPAAMAFVTLMDSALNALKGTIDQYNADTNPADKATLLAKIRTILNDIAANFQNFLSALSPTNSAIFETIIGLANVILSAIAGFINALPVSGTTVMATSFKVGDKTIPIIPKLYQHVADYKHDYNQVADINHHPEIDLH